MKNFICTVMFVLLIQMALPAKAADSSYVERSIILHTTTGDISGTITTPKKFFHIPIALIIAGSGPTDRNGNNPSMKNNSLKQLAVALANEKHSKCAVLINVALPQVLRLYNRKVTSGLKITFPMQLHGLLC